MQGLNSLKTKLVFSGHRLHIDLLSQPYKGQTFVWNIQLHYFLI